MNELIDETRNGRKQFNRLDFRMGGKGDGYERLEALELALSLHNPFKKAFSEEDFDLND